MRLFLTVELWYSELWTRELWYTVLNFNTVNFIHMSYCIFARDMIRRQRGEMSWLPLSSSSKPATTRRTQSADRWTDFGVGFGAAKKKRSTRLNQVAVQKDELSGRDSQLEEMKKKLKAAEDAIASLRNAAAKEEGGGGGGGQERQKQAQQTS